MQVKLNRACMYWQVNGAASAEAEEIAPDE